MKQNNSKTWQNLIQLITACGYDFNEIQNQFDFNGLCENQKNKMEEYRKIEKLIFEHSIESDGITLDDDQPPALDSVLESILFRYDGYVQGLLKKVKEQENKMNSLENYIKWLLKL